MVVTGSGTQTACPGALGCFIHQKSRSSLDASSQKCQMIPRRRKKRISHVRAVMTILWERFAYAGSVSTLNPEIQKKRKQKSHQGFTLAKIPSPRLLHKLRSTRERKSCALHAFRLHQQRHPSTRTRPRRAGTTQAPETSGSDFPASTAHPNLLQRTQLESVGRGNYSPISTNVTTISESVGCVLAVCSQ